MVVLYLHKWLLFYSKCIGMYKHIYTIPMDPLGIEYSVASSSCFFFFFFFLLLLLLVVVVVVVEEKIVTRLPLLKIPDIVGRSTSLIMSVLGTSSTDFFPLVSDIFLDC